MAEQKRSLHWVWHRLHDLHTFAWIADSLHQAWNQKGLLPKILTLIPPVVGGLIAFIRHISIWQFASLEAACIFLPVPLIAIFFRPQENPPTIVKSAGVEELPQTASEVRDSVVASKVDPTPFNSKTTSKLQFGETMFADIGPGMGNQALLIAVQNAEMGFEHSFHNVQAELTFTNIYSKETIKTPGWFTLLHNGKVIASPINSITLNSRNSSERWLIVYVRSNIHTGQYWFAGPQNELTPLVAWTVLTDKRQHLFFGKWQIKIIITCDSGDRIDREIEVQAE